MNKRAIGTDWLAVDWGTTHLRIWFLDAQGRILAEVCDDSGMATLSSDQFYTRFTRLAAPFLSPDKVITVIACGRSEQNKAGMRRLILPLLALRRG